MNPGPSFLSSGWRRWWRMRSIAAGFRETTIRGDYTGNPATPDSKELVFTALK
jgi:hypothetical protein